MKNKQLATEIKRIEKKYYLQSKECDRPLFVANGLLEKFGIHKHKFTHKYGNGSKQCEVCFEWFNP